jgi:hypothetical protein
MAELIGKVKCIQVAEDAAFTSVVEDSTGVRETFILWWDGITTRPSRPSEAVSSRATGSPCSAKLLERNTTVSVFHQDNSAIVQNVQLGTF